MKKLVFNIAILICVIFTSCSDDDSVNIVSLNTFGTKFCRNDVVKVFVSAELSDDTDVSYEWGCSMYSCSFKIFKIAVAEGLVIPN